MAKKKLPPSILEFFRKEGSKGGKMSGAARMEKLTPEHRSAIAKNAVAAREAKRAAAQKAQAKKVAATKSKKSTK